MASLFPDSRRGSYASSEGGREEKGGRIGGYPIVTIDEATVDAHGCVDDGDEDDRMLVDEDERVLKNAVFEAWRNVMRRMISLHILLALPLR